MFSLLQNAMLHSSFFLTLPIFTVGWPSFSDVAEKGTVLKIRDSTHGMTRIEVVCAKV